MKKILLFDSALAGLFLAASCQQEMLEPEVAEKGQVTFTIEAPAAIQTKAIADGLNVDQLIYEVWITGATANQDDLSNATRLYQATTDMVQDGDRMKANITLDLVNDQNFTVLFWAQKKGIGVYNTDWLNAVTYTDLNAKAYAANDNRLDAFYSKAFVSDGATSTPTVTLRRPFAQVNLCTLNNKEAAQTPSDYNIALSQSKMRLDAVPTVFNIATSAATNYVAMEFAYHDVPSGDDQMITVNGKEYYYAGMNYVFAGANIVLTYDIATKLNGSVDANVNNTIANVPLKENHRTNIVGNLLTSKVDYEIIVDAAFDGEYYGPDFVEVPAYDEATKTWTVTNRDELLYVAQQVNTGANSFYGQTVQVVNDIDLKNIPWTPIGKSTSVAFNGMFEGVAVTKSATDNPTISNLKIENGNCSGFFGVLCNGGKVRNLNFSNVTISGERQLGVVAGQVYGNLQQPTIDNVTVENVTITAVPAFDGTTYDNGDKVGGIAGLIGQQAYIKGCTVKNATFTGYRDMGGIVGCTQNGHSCNLSGNHSENIDFVVTSQYVPYNGNTPHGATGAIRGGTRSNAGDVIEGNTSSEGTISEVVLVNDQVSLQNAINAAGVGETHIKFANDITGNVVLIQKPSVKININGDDKKFNGFIKVHSNSNHYADAALTIKNVNFETAITYLNKDNEEYFSFIEALENGSERYSTNITVDECTFIATEKAKNIAVALQIKASKNAKALNCTATGLHSLVQAQSCDETVVVNGCTINGKNGVAFKQVKAATVEGTTITAREYGIRFDGNTDNYGIVVKNNTVTAVQPLIVRKMTGKNNTIALEGTNTLTTEELYQIVLTNGSDDAAYVEPTGTYTLTGADNYVVFPRDNYGEKVANGLYKNAKNYYVANAEGLVALSSIKLAGGENVNLIADIDLTGVEFNGLGAFHSENNNAFDGQGHTVSNWTNHAKLSDLGFVKNWVGPIKNLTIKNASLKTAGRSGIIAGNVYSNIENCHVVDCTLEDSYWACGLIAGLYNAGSVTNCSATNSTVKSNGGTGAIVGVVNESAGTRSFTNCVVTGCTVNNTGAYGEAYCGALVCGMINISNSTVKFVGCEYSDNTKVGSYVGDLYYAADDDITVVVE